MRYSPEQHLKAARENEIKAKSAPNPERAAALKLSGQRHRIVARAGRQAQAKQQTQEALDRALKAAHETRSTPRSTGR